MNAPAPKLWRGAYSTCDPRECTVNATQQPSCSPLLTKEGWRDRASPIGRILKRRCAGVVAHTEALRRERPPQLRFQRSSPSFVRRGFTSRCYSPTSKFILPSTQLSVMYRAMAAGVGSENHRPVTPDV